MIAVRLFPRRLKTMHLIHCLTEKIWRPPIRYTMLSQWGWYWTRWLDYVIPTIRSPEVGPGRRGDIQLNHGPKCKSVYRCGYCQRNVKYGAKATCCDNCDIWFHKSCVSMPSTLYSELNSVENWFCYRGFTHNCDTFHAYEYSVNSSNSFFCPNDCICRRSVYLAIVSASPGPQ